MSKKMSKWKKIKKDHYGKSCVVQLEKGYIDFSSDGMKQVKDGENLSYNEYLEIQHDSCDDCRQYFAMSYFDNLMCYFKGQIDRFDVSKNKVVFKRLFVDGEYSDGIGFFGKEDHVWMDMHPFEDFSVGDCIRFSATIYRYLKTGGGKRIAFGLMKPEFIQKIDSYEVPTDEQLIDQQINQLVCETCRYYDHCFMESCIANEQERKERFNTLKSLEPGRFTPFTVMLAYELEYRIMLQTGGFRLDKSDKNYVTMKRLIEICESHPTYYYGDVQDALIRMMHPDKPRLYIED